MEVETSGTLSLDFVFFFQMDDGEKSGEFCVADEDFCCADPFFLGVSEVLKQGSRRGGGDFTFFFWNVQPKNWGKFPILTHIFQMG